MKKESSRSVRPRDLTPEALTVPGEGEGEASLSKRRKSQIKNLYRFTTSE
jgi:hypothetical protein